MPVQKYIQENIEYLDSKIVELKQEKSLLERQRGEKTSQKGIESWRGFSFESSSELTPEFSAFARDFKKHLKEEMQKVGIKLVNVGRGHFYISGFLKSIATGKLAYFSMSDVRHFPDSWYDNLLIRTAKHDKDFTGGSNDYATLPLLKVKALSLTS